jgi:osmotically inducible protein OsmC
MPTRNASAVWNGDLFKGSGTTKLGSGAFEGQYNFSSRFENGVGTNPEELLGRQPRRLLLDGPLAGPGQGRLHPAARRHRLPKVTVDKVGEGFKITKIRLETQASVPNIDEAKFQEIANATKTGCPISQALSAVPMELDAKLVK